MKTWSKLATVALLMTVPLSGCFGGGDDGSAGPEPNPADFGDETYDEAIGNAGFRVAGSLTGAGTPLGAGSAAQLQVVDQASSDSEGALDKATFILDAKSDDLNVVARLRQMATAGDLGMEGDAMGGVGHRVPVFGGTGLGPAEFPEAVSYLFATGFAQVKIAEQTLPDTFPMFVAVTQGFRDDAGAMEAAAATDDLEMHIYIFASEDGEISGVADGFLYYFFETVGMGQLKADKKAAVGADLVEPEPPNTPPLPVANILVNGTAAVQALKENDENVTVTLDASNSTDDGEISVYVWKIFELNRTGAWEKPTEGQPLASGQSVEYQFIAPGPKRIELILRDDRGAVANVTVPFFIDQHRVYTNPEGNVHLQTLSGSPGCQPDLNCFTHRASVLSGAQNATFTFTDTGGQVEGVTSMLFAPNVEPCEDNVDAQGSCDSTALAKGDDVLTLTADLLTEVGSYQYKVYWTAAAGLTYEVDALISYSPEVLPEPGAPLGAEPPADGGEEEPEEEPSG